MSGEVGPEVGSAGGRDEYSGCRNGEDGNVGERELMGSMVQCNPYVRLMDASSF